MNQKVVFLDVDGTIVNDKGIIPESTQIAIRKAVENGHKLVVCSGRSLFQLPQMLLDLGFSGMVTVTLLEKGNDIAVHIYERHTVLSKMLEHLGVSPEVAKEDACKLEHDLSDESFTRIKEHFHKVIGEVE